MRTKVTLVLIFLNVALFFFIFKFERSWRTEDQLKEARRRVFGSETASIRSLQVTSTVAGGPSYSAVRVRDDWMLTEPLDWPANQEAVTNIVQVLQFLENEASFEVDEVLKNGRSLAEYGLETPRITLSFTSDDAGGAAGAKGASTGPATVLRIGDTTKDGNRTYVLSPDGTRIHVVGRALLEAVTVSADQLRSDALITIQVFEARALTVQTSGARVRIAKREAGRWVFDTIVNARANKTDLELTINGLNKLRALSFPSDAPSVLPSVSPALRITIDGNGRSETLLLGEQVTPASADASTPAKQASIEFYGQLMNGNSVRAPVFTVAVPTAMLELLRNAQNDLREKRVLDIDPATVTSITLAAPNQGVPPLTLQRLDANAADSTWHLVRPVASGSGTQTIAAEPAAVKRLLDRLALLSAQRFESDAPSNAQLEAWGFNRPEREITIVANAAPGATSRPVVLQLGTGAGGVFARTGPQGDLGPSVYAVSSDLAQDFPMDPAAWRNRTVRDLPAAARISAIKITDLAGRQEIVDTALDASGKPVAQVRDPAAVRDLVPHLRTLHAKRFVEDKFVERVVAAGDERGWRYQLDATIALPGASGEQTSTSTLFLTERLGGGQQIAGSREFGLVFEIDQPMIDALWKLTYGARDPGPQLEKK